MYAAAMCYTQNEKINKFEVIFFRVVSTDVEDFPCTPMSKQLNTVYLMCTIATIVSVWVERSTAVHRSKHQQKRIAAQQVQRMLVVPHSPQTAVCRFGFGSGEYRNPGIFRVPRVLGFLCLLLFGFEMMRHKRAPATCAHSSSAPTILTGSQLLSKNDVYFSIPSLLTAAGVR